MTDDLNLMLAPFVEGLVMGAVDLERLATACREIGWNVE